MFRHQRSLDAHKGAVLAVRYTRDGKYCMSCGADRCIKLWNPRRSLVQTYEGPHAKEVSGMAIAKDSARFASCGGDATAFVWDIATGAVTRRLEGHAARVNAVAFCALDQKVVATGSYDNTVRLWDLRSQSRAAIQTLGDFKDSVTSLVVATDKTLDWALVAASVDGNVRTYDLRRGLLHTDSLGTPVTSLALSRDGACLAASCLDSSVRLLELNGGTQLNLYTGHKHDSFKLDACLSHDDAHLASGASLPLRTVITLSAASEDGRVVIWRLVEADVAAELKGVHTCVVVSSRMTLFFARCAVASVAWHPSQASVLAASFDGTISLWEPPTR